MAWVALILPLMMPVAGLQQETQRKSIADKAFKARSKYSSSHYKQNKQKEIMRREEKQAQQNFLNLNATSAPSDSLVELAASQSDAAAASADHSKAEQMNMAGE